MKKVKNIIVVLLFAISIMGVSKLSAWGLGFYGGGNLADLTSSAETDYLSKLGFGFGLYANFSLSKYVSWQTDLLYIVRGAEARVSQSNDADLDFRLSYLEVPLLLKLALPVTRKKKFNVYVETGFGLDLLTATHIGVLVVASLSNSEASNLQNTNFTPVFLSYIIGAGVSYKVSAGVQTFIESRFSLSLSRHHERPQSELKTSRYLHFSRGCF